MSHPRPHLPIHRRWMEQKHPMPVTVAIIHREIGDECRYLLIRRLKEPYMGKWALVGGKWDFGETLAESIVREIREETGVRTTFAALHNVVNELIVPRAETDQGAHFLLFVCDVIASADKAKEQSEGAVGWFTFPEMLALNESGQIVPTDYLILENYVKRPFDISYTEAEVYSDGRLSVVHRFEIK